jgi:alpha-N-arabinofuranosidase
LCWNFLRNPQPEDWSLTERPGWLRLNGSAVTLDDQESPAFLGRRQQHFEFQAEAFMEFSPANQDEAGLAVRMNERHHAEIAVVLAQGKRHVITRVRLGSVVTANLGPALPDGPVVLTITGDRELYRFAYAAGGSDVQEVGQVDCRFFASEVAGGHTGAYLGMYATGRGRPCAAPADFDYFDYRPAQDRFGA